VRCEGDRSEDEPKGRKALEGIEFEIAYPTVTVYEAVDMTDSFLVL